MSLLLSGNNIRNQSYRFEISDNSHVGEVRRFGGNLAREAEFNETTAGRLSIVINELGTNLLKHATRGELILRIGQDSTSNRNVEMICLDRGSGLSDLDQCLKDGFSTTATSGTGLGAIRRQSDQFDVYSNSRGTVIYTAISVRSAEPVSKLQENYYLGGISLPVDGETECGDGWCVRTYQDQVSILVADGLGHGMLAHQASEAAIEALQESEQSDDLPRLMQEIHQRLRSTRGAAVTVCHLDLKTQTLNHLSIGNVRTVVSLGTEPKSLLSHSGTLGLQFKTVRPQTVQVPHQARLILHTDGLTQRWNLQEYPGLQTRHPAVIAGVLYRDFTRGKDDVTVLVGGWV